MTSFPLWLFFVNIPNIVQVAQNNVQQVAFFWRGRIRWRTTSKKSNPGCDWKWWFKIVQSCRRLKWLPSPHLPHWGFPCKKKNTSRLNPSLPVQRGHLVCSAPFHPSRIFPWWLVTTVARESTRVSPELLFENVPELKLLVLLLYRNKAEA